VEPWATGSCRRSTRPMNPEKCQHYCLDGDAIKTCGKA
jgi:hypothetical protein